MSKPTPDTDGCPHCGTEPYSIDERDFWMCGNIRYEEKCVVRTNLCSEREARKAAESKLDEARAVAHDLAVIASHCLGWHDHESTDAAIRITAALKRWKKSK